MLLTEFVMSFLTVIGGIYLTWEECRRQKRVSSERPQRVTDHKRIPNADIREKMGKNISLQQ
jgi:hypothetical protein